MLFIGLCQHFPFSIAEHLSRIDTPQHEIRVPINICEEVFPSPGVLEGRGEKAMKFIIIGIKGINVAIEVVFESMQLIILITVIVLSLFDVFKLSQMLLVLHQFYYAL